MLQMLQFKDGHFHAYGVSFRLAEGFFLETCPDLEHECGLVAWDPNEEFKVTWDFIEDCDGPAAELQKFFKPGWGMMPLSDIKPISLGGLDGYQVFYHSHDGQYYEARFALKDDVEFSLLVYTKGRDIQEVVERPEVQTILKGVHAD